MQVQISYEISQGQGSKMYTLWRVTDTPNYGIKYQYIQNLSTDKETAFLKAKELVGDRELIDSSVDNLQDIIRSDSGLMTFGKHRGTAIVDLPDGYLLWVSNDPTVDVNNYNSDYTKRLCTDFQVKLATDEAVKRGLLRDYKGKLLPSKLVDTLEAKDALNANSKHIGTVNGKIEVSVTLERETSFDSMYGTTWVTTMRTEAGDIIVYMGKPLTMRDTTRYSWCDIVTGEEYGLKIDVKEVSKCEDQDIVNKANELNALYYFMKGDKAVFIDDRDFLVPGIKIGEKYTLKATVKAHKDYKGVNQTQVIRPKLF